MRYYVVFVDVGFVRAAGAHALRQNRESARLDAAALVAWCRSLATRLPGAPEFLRAYWYDGGHDPRHPEYLTQRAYLEAVSAVPGLALRLGHIQERRPAWQHALGQALRAACRELDVDHGALEACLGRRFTFRAERVQKGVDTRMVLDMVRLGQDAVYDTAVVMTGDRDLAEGIQVIQDHGRRVVLAAPHGAGVAAELRRLADDQLVVEQADLEHMLLAGRRAAIT